MEDLDKNTPIVVTPVKQMKLIKAVKKSASAKTAPKKIKKQICNIKKASAAIAKLQVAKRKIEVTAANNSMGSGIKQERIQRNSNICRDFHKTPPTTQQQL
jgi:hypothetical protein